MKYLLYIGNCKSQLVEEEKSYIEMMIREFLIFQGTKFSKVTITLQEEE